MLLSGKSEDPPHAHILGICNNANKPKTIADYDSVVCAEIPDKDTFPELYAIVTKFMMHRPCGLENVQRTFPRISQKKQWNVMAIHNIGEEMMANML